MAQAQKQSIEFLDGQSDCQRDLRCSAVESPKEKRLSRRDKNSQSANSGAGALFSESIRPPTNTFPENQLALARFPITWDIFCAHGGQGARRQPGR